MITVDRIFALHVDNPGSISSILYGPQAPPEITMNTELRLNPKYHRVCPINKYPKIKKCLLKENLGTLVEESLYCCGIDAIILYV